MRSSESASASPGSTSRLPAPPMTISRIRGWLSSAFVRAGTTGRRERLRAETTAEIKGVALELMASGGPEAITLRAIAREMGMTANAIYGYFATRDDLVTVLINDVYTELADAVDTAWESGEFEWSDFDAGLVDKVRADFPGLPPAAVALALRVWGRLHGLVSLEVYGHLRTQTTSPDKLFREEVTQLVRSLGIPPRS